MFSLPLKKYPLVIVIWLITMQMLAPFMHAHPSGVGAVTGAGLHVHISDDYDLDTVSNSFESHSIDNEVIHQHIVAVASGFAEKLKLDLTGVVLCVLIVLALSMLVLHRHYQPLASPYIKPHPNRSRSPRAPPALN